MIKKRMNNIGMNPISKKRKRNILKRFIEKYDFRMLKREIESYGYKYSFKNFMFVSLSCLAVIFFIAFYMKLRIEYILVLGITIMLVIPFLIRSQFCQLYQIKRFEMVTNYLDNIIPIFKRTPIITNAWREVLDLIDGEMKEVVEDALNRVLTNTEDPNVMKIAFSMIESHFPNSRIHAVHQMMYTIETQNTKNYVLSIDNVWLDVQSWITRTTLFQKSLKERKNKLTLLSLLTMAANCLFVAMYSSNDIFNSFTDNIVYQISSTIFIIILILTMCIFQMKLNGKWLLDDNTVSITNAAMKSFEKILNGHSLLETGLKEKVVSCALVVLGIVLFVFDSNLIILILCWYCAYMFYSQKKRVEKNNIRKIKKYLQIEFPSWIRDITLNLQNLTVINAIESSKQTASSIMNYYIDQFLYEAYLNPVSIKPYNDYLIEFNIDGVKSTMKSLYSLQTLDREEMQKQTSHLIIRNQEMLAKAEELKNEDSVSGLKFLGFVPVGIFIVQMLISMGLLFWVMMNLMSQSVAF